MNSPIARIDLRLPGRWYGWRPGEGPRAATAAAALLAAGPVAGSRLRAAVEAVDRAVVGLNARHVRVGAWVPDGSGDVVATLACELLAEAPGGPDAAEGHLARVRRRVYRSQRTPTRVTHHAASLRQLPAGPAVVALRSQGAARHEVAWTVFPPGAAEAVELRFETRDAERVGALGAEAERVCASLAVVLARHAPPDGRALPGRPPPARARTGAPR